MTYKIKESYFDSIETLTKARDLYHKIDGWYHRTIDGPDLSVEFMKDEDCKLSGCKLHRVTDRPTKPMFRPNRDEASKRFKTIFQLLK